MEAAYNQFRILEKDFSEERTFLLMPSIVGYIAFYVGFIIFGFGFWTDEPLLLIRNFFFSLVGAVGGLFIGLVGLLISRIFLKFKYKRTVELILVSVVIFTICLVSGHISALTADPDKIIFAPSLPSNTEITQIGTYVNDKNEIVLVFPTCGSTIGTISAEIIDYGGEGIHERIWTGAGFRESIQKGDTVTMIISNSDDWMMSSPDITISTLPETILIRVRGVEEEMITSVISIKDIPRKGRGYLLDGGYKIIQEKEELLSWCDPRWDEK